MPTYAYKCMACENEYDELRLIACRNDPAPCPNCGEPGRLIISAPMPPIVSGNDTDSARRKQNEDKKIGRMAERAKRMKDDGIVPMDGHIGINDKWIQD